jgi:protein-L-isoaspartate(D-aspartate) O-methyltransferase
VLAHLGARVHSIERIETLARDAAARLTRLGLGDVVVHTGDGAAGLPREAPFDRILLTAAASRLPSALLDQLGPDGILVAPVGEEEQWLGVWRKGESPHEGRWICPVRFVPLITSDA